MYFSENLLLTIMAARLGACLLPTSINLTLRGIVSEKNLLRKSAKPLLFYCGTMPVSLLVDQRKMIFL